MAAPGRGSYYLKTLQDHSLAFGVTPANNFEIRGSQAVPLNERHHIAAVFAPGERMNIYLDGQVYYEVTNSIPSSTKVVPETPFTMGQVDTAADGYALMGLFDDVRVCRVAMRQCEIIGCIRNNDASAGP